MNKTLIMGAPKTLDSWRVCYTRVNKRPYLTGLIVDKWVITSPIVEVLDTVPKSVRTYSGSIYIIGPSPVASGVSFDLPIGKVEQPPMKRE